MSWRKAVFLLASLFAGCSIESENKQHAAEASERLQTHAILRLKGAQKRFPPGIGGRPEESDALSQLAFDSGAAVGDRVAALHALGELARVPENLPSQALALMDRPPQDDLRVAAIFALAPWFASDTSSADAVNTLWEEVRGAGAPGRCVELLGILHRLPMQKVRKEDQEELFGLAETAKDVACQAAALDLAFVWLGSASSSDLTRWIEMAKVLRKEHHSYHVRGRAVRVGAIWGDASVIDDGLKDGSAYVQAEAYFAIGQLRQVVSVPLALRACRNEQRAASQIRGWSHWDGRPGLMERAIGQRGVIGEAACMAVARLSRGVYAYVSQPEQPTSTELEYNWGLASRWWAMRGRALGSLSPQMPASGPESLSSGR